MDYLHPEKYPENYKSKLDYIRESITEQLKDCPNFSRIDFCDVGANGVQIRGFHKSIKGFTYGNQVTINYNFLNIQQAIDSFVTQWKECDNKKELEKYKNFLEQGEKWGWD